ncbi:AAA family ATPase [Desulfococcaceae bacterium HSG8]|nr:AAA family ATPase [Desulfococcaceae bacterium HSG8]
MTKKNTVDIKIRRLQIANYKGIDELDLYFPRPKMPDDPDVVVMGSRNGLGKTSVLECCALLLIGLSGREYMFKLSRGGYLPVDMPEMIIRAGASIAQIEGEIVIGDMTIILGIAIHKSGTVKIKNKPEQNVQELLGRDETDIVENFISTVGGMSPDPLLSEYFLYFHSYRKVQEGNPELGMMVERGNIRHRVGYGPGYGVPMSTFKLRILHSLMSRAKLFEDWSDEQSEDVLTKLNEFVKRYAGGTIQKLRPSADNTVDFRIHPVDGGSSFTFDGLSSGQKEIIATLFLIWYQTRDKPGVVLIDEPELHLNPEWHRDFIRQISKIAPKNQYIIATHSEDVFDSVDEDQRFLLQNSTGSKS